jgi:two-component system sensor histidine kinase HydH
MKFLFKKNRKSKLYFPAISIIMAVCLLFVLISISTYRNLNRDKDRSVEFSLKQGLTLLRALEAGARTGMSLPSWNEDSIRTLLEETGRDTNVVYIYLQESDGLIVHHSVPTIEGTTSNWLPSIEFNRSNDFRLRQIPDGPLVLDIAKRFMPLAPLYNSTAIEGFYENILQISHKHYGSIIVLGMRMDHLNISRKADLRHAVVMGAIVLALGSGALFFIFVIQNYYVVEKTLQSTEDYASKIVDSMPNGLISIDEHGKIVTYNQNALDLLDMPSSDIEGLNLNKLIDLGKTGIAKTLSDNSNVMNHEIKYKNHDGKNKPLLISATPLKSENRDRNGAVILISDLQKIRSLEERVRQSEKLAALGKLSAGVAHEIRNPLSSIRGFAGFLASSLSEHPREHEYAKIMVREVDRINHVVSDLLTFAKPDKIQANFLKINELINHTKALVEADAKSRGIKIMENVQPSIPAVFMDENQITQAILNLMLNAIQFSPKNSGLVEIGAKWNTLENELNLWVQDNGPGLSSEQRRNMFNPFYTTRKLGTGLGLAIVHNITTNHGGHVKVESPPKGSESGTRIDLIISHIKFGNENETKNPDS